MELLNVTKSHKDGKKLHATFRNCKTDKIKHIDFGSDVSTTYAEGAPKSKMQAYIKRHRVNEDWSKVNPGSLSRYVLWSKPSIKEGIAEFKKKFHC